MFHLERLSAHREYHKNYSKWYDPSFLFNIKKIILLFLILIYFIVEIGNIGGICGKVEIWGTGFY